MRLFGIAMLLCDVPRPSLIHNVNHECTAISLASLEVRSTSVGLYFQPPRCVR